MSVDKTLKQIKDKDGAMKNLLSASLKDSKNTKLAEVVDKAANWSDAMTELSAIETTSNLNNMVGNLLGFIAKQAIEGQELTENNIFGWCFKESEEILEGGGLSYVEQILNGAGTNGFTNYQTSTNTTGEIAFGSSFSNSLQLNTEYQALPFSTTTYGLSASTTLYNNFFITINKTVPLTWAQLSTLSAIKASQIIDNYYLDVKNSLMIYKYSLGLLLFTGGVYTDTGTVSFAPLNVVKPSTSYTNVYEYMQEFLLPQLMEMQQLSAKWNAGADYSIGNTWINHPAWEIPGLNYNDNGYTANVLNNGSTQNLTIYMSPNTSATIMSTLNLPNFKDANDNNLNIQGKNGVITSINGIKVKVTGTKLTPTAQSDQGTAITPNLDSGQALDDGQIWVVSDDYLTFAKVYENTYTSEPLGNAMVKLVRLQAAYIPIFKPWKNGAIFYGVPMSTAKLPVTTSTSSSSSSSTTTKDAVY